MLNIVGDISGGIQWFEVLDGLSQRFIGPFRINVS